MDTIDRCLRLGHPFLPNIWNPEAQLARSRHRSKLRWPVENQCLLLRQDIVTGGKRYSKVKTDLDDPPILGVLLEEVLLKYRTVMVALELMIHKHRDLVWYRVLLGPGVLRGGKCGEIRKQWTGYSLNQSAMRANNDTNDKSPREHTLIAVKNIEAARLGSSLIFSRHDLCGTRLPALDCISARMEIELPMASNTA